MKREDFAEMANEMGLKGTTVEVGVAEGYFAKHNLGIWKGSKYLMVDPWERYPGWNDLDYLKQSDLDAQYNALVELWKGDARVEIHRKKSMEIVSSIPNGSLDWVYLDGDHEYPAVSTEMPAWWMKLRKGGLFSGHDYEKGFGVIRAVDEFVRAQRIVLHITEESWTPSWWFVK